MDNKHEYTLIIEAGRLKSNYWKDLWRYRELFYFLSWRDILVRYKQTVLGIAWNVVRPLLTMAIFTFIFGKLAKLPSMDMPYSLIVFSGLIPWQFFASSLTGVSNSLVVNSNLISKVYFPRLIVPMSAFVVNLVDFLISLCLFVGLMIWYQVLPGWKIVFLPMFLALEIFSLLGLGLWMASLNVKYRDFNFISGFLIQIGLYISPVGFISSLVPEQWRLIYYLNPMVGIIDGFRWSLLPGITELNLISIYMSLGVSILSFMLGMSYFRKAEQTFADII
ncbi:MAG: ABC transporter permease [Nitrospiraceae bacterium]|nr:ABC transporter permease [Nitrospiraceae bacterium]